MHRRRTSLAEFCRRSGETEFNHFQGSFAALKITVHLSDAVCPKSFLIFRTTLAERVCLGRQGGQSALRPQARTKANLLDLANADIGVAAPAGAYKAEPRAARLLGRSSAERILLPEKALRAFSGKWPYFSARAEKYAKEHV